MKNVRAEILIGGLLAASAMLGNQATAGSFEQTRAIEPRPVLIAQAAPIAAPTRASPAPAPRVALAKRLRRPRMAQSKTMKVKKGPMGEMAEIPTDVMFNFGSSSLRPEAVNILAECAEMIRRDGNKNMQVIGHTDSVGSAAYNLALSKQRAEVVTEWLVKQGGIPKEDLTAKGAGESQPKATNATARGRAENRRVEVVMPMGGSPHQPMADQKKPEEKKVEEKKVEEKKVEEKKPDEKLPEEKK